MHSSYICIEKSLQGKNFVSQECGDKLALENRIENDPCSFSLKKFDPLQMDSVPIVLFQANVHCSLVFSASSFGGLGEAFLWR